MVAVAKSIVFVEFLAICVNKIQEGWKYLVERQDSLKALLCDTESAPRGLLLHQAGWSKGEKRLYRWNHMVNNVLEHIVCSVLIGLLGCKILMNVGKPGLGKEWLL